MHYSIVGFLPHHHGTDLSFCIIIIQRHLWYVKISCQFFVMTDDIVQSLVHLGILIIENIHRYPVL